MAVLPPHQTARVYVGEVNAFHPDYVEFPSFAEAEGLACVQRPGDIIFTPSNWWHQVRNETSTLALTENFINETNGQFLCAEDESDRRMLKLFADYGIEPLSMMSLPSSCSTEHRRGSTE